MILEPLKVTSRAGIIKHFKKGELFLREGGATAPELVTKADFQTGQRIRFKFGKELDGWFSYVVGGPECY